MGPKIKKGPTGAFGVPKEYYYFKEVIQPQVPLRLPCYDFALLTGPGFDHGQRPWPHPNPVWVA